MKKFWDNLGTREKLYIRAGAGIGVMILLFQFAILPFWEDRTRVAKAVETQEKILEEMYAQLAEYRLLRHDTDRLQRAIASRLPNFTLYSFVERKAREAGVRGNIKTIQPSRGLSSGSLEETMADVSLEKITTLQLVRFLYYADSPRDAVRIRKLNVRKSTESSEYLTVTVQLATYQAAAGSRPGPAPARQGG
ncbi:MAG TPA: type II secretion system protein GspM [Syntrophales bacterium]|nr:type II secretion system protein GspM [Syntrophales bacterium]